MTMKDKFRHSINHKHPSSLSAGVMGLVLLAFAATLALSSCGGKSGHFRIEGRFRSFNQGEFYIYSPYGGKAGTDTIKVADGRFAYEVALEEPATFVIIFPNFSEQAVFGQPGATAEISGDASHLKEMEIKGTKDNKLMTEFRMNANKMSPPEVRGAVEEFVHEHPESPVSLYLINRHLVTSQSPDYAKAYELLGVMAAKTPENIQIQRMKTQLESLRAAAVGAQLPDFKATDTEGRRVSKAQLGGKVNIISTWATWSYESQTMQRRLRVMKKKYGEDIAMVSICLDGRPDDCTERIRRDSIGWPNVCDGTMWATPLLSTLGLATVPGNIVADKKGRVVARNLDSQQMEEKIKDMLK